MSRRRGRSPRAQVKGQTTMEMPQRRTRGIVKALSRYFLEHPNQVVAVDGLANETGYEERSIQKAVTYLIATKPEFKKVEIIVRGQSWRYNPDAKPADADNSRYFEQVAELGNGAFILRDDEGNAYSARLKSIDLS